MLDATSSVEESYTDIKALLHLLSATIDALHEKSPSSFTQFWIGVQIHFAKYQKLGIFFSVEIRTALILN